VLVLHCEGWTVGSSRNRAFDLSCKAFVARIGIVTELHQVTYWISVVTVLNYFKALYKCVLLYESIML
jgi:hypothetical protein